MPKVIDLQIGIAPNESTTYLLPLFGRECDAISWIFTVIVWRWTQKRGFNLQWISVMYKSMEENENPPASTQGMTIVDLWGIHLDINH